MVFLPDPIVGLYSFFGTSLPATDNVNPKGPGGYCPRFFCRFFTHFEHGAQFVVKLFSFFRIHSFLSCFFILGVMNLLPIYGLSICVQQILSCTADALKWFLIRIDRICLRMMFALTVFSGRIFSLVPFADGILFPQKYGIHNTSRKEHRLGNSMIKECATLWLW